MKRRDFIQKTAVGATFASLGGLSLASCAPEKQSHITILHTNDVHSHIDPFPADHPDFPNQGGVARRATLIENIRQENPNTILLDAGDIFQGTPYFNYYGGELEYKLMSMLRYDAVTLGNHDFDNGIEGILAQLPNANFDFVSANYAFVNTPLEDYIKPYKIFVRGEIRIGVFGLGIELEGLVEKKNYGETVYIDPIEIAQDITKELKEKENCDLVICLSHLGYHYKGDKVSDLKLAAQTQDIDLIIGGHTHTFLDKPAVVKNKINEDVLVNQVGCYGINVGRVDFYFDKASKVKSQGKSILV
ncbi:bifunctional metallophosphatase/5'-nucleotidase [Neptunitalea lumnitzerae]|uniref:Metallophosphatase n=1 Tax=Neptunitalea lumnitzerae TaxID=2965509 RepID=A0ABQ5MKB9_9FLAO|nr:metallophosphatase [Neptunitalea sp. Y10]GLB49751.1 metallophosphatase [Neptunitalea sp. Y10]